MSYIKNDSGGSKTWVGQVVADGAYYEIGAIEKSAWASNSTLLTDIGSGNAVVARDDSGNTDISDVNQGIDYLKGSSPVDSDGYPMQRLRAFPHSDGHRFRGTGVSGTSPFGTTYNLDYKLTEDRMINGVHMILQNHVWDDYVKFQVVDVDNVLGYGAGLVLDEFASNWHLDTALSSQGYERIEYPAKVVKDLYIRIVYVSTGAVDVKIKANLYLHKVPT